VPLDGCAIICLLSLAPTALPEDLTVMLLGFMAGSRLGFSNSCKESIDRANPLWMRRKLVSCSLLQGDNPGVNANKGSVGMNIYCTWFKPHCRPLSDRKQRTEKHT
jgi:hypothetical protein